MANKTLFASLRDALIAAPAHTALLCTPLRCSTKHKPMGLRMEAWVEGRTAISYDSGPAMRSPDIRFRWTS